MKIDKQELFEATPVPKAVWSLAAPTIIGMIVMMMYNLIDTFFIAQTGDPNQVAAVSLAMPVFMVLMGFGNLFGVGASANISRSLGAKEYHRVANISSFAFYGALFLGIVIGIVSLLYMDQLVSLTGADSASGPFVQGYLTYIALGSPFIILSSALGYLIRSEGNAKAAMFGMIISTVLNIVLDPIFIFLFDMGVVGAAVATVIANAVSVAYYIIVIAKAKGYVSLNIKNFTMKNKIAREVISVGFPSSINTILMSLANIIFNIFLASYGNDPVAAMGIVTKVAMMFIMFYLGLTVGIQPLLGYCYGARNYDRLRNTIKYAIKTLAIIGACFLIVFWFAAEPIIKTFIDDPAIISYGIDMLRAQVLMAPALGVVFLVISTMQVLGKGTVSLLLTLCRQGLAFIPAILLLDHFFGLAGLIWVQPVADVVSVVASSLAFIWLFKKLRKYEEDHNYMTKSAITKSNKTQPSLATNDVNGEGNVVNA